MVLLLLKSLPKNIFQGLLVKKWAELLRQAQAWAKSWEREENYGIFIQHFGSKRKAVDESRAWHINKNVSRIYSETNSHDSYSSTVM